ncbi:hypothetical protein V8J36_08795 [Frigidibacter sp. MR17.14]|uniref:hypothetical protein n=1 Tax=Frigidibacter sp. MR17.14 TaxID=3126509 RepID=UPI003012FBCF
MQTMRRSAEGLRLMVDLHWERLAIPLAILTGLFGGAAIGTRLIQTWPQLFH